MRRGAPWIAIGAVLILLSLGAVGLGGWLAVRAGRAGDPKMALIWGCGGGLTALSLLFLGAGFASEGLTRMAATVHVDVEPRAARLGETLAVRIAVEAHRPLIAGPIRLRLMTKEFMAFWVWDWFRKTRRRKEEREQTRVVQEIQIADRVELLPGLPQRYMAALVVPIDGMASFRREERGRLGTDVHAFEWWVELEVGLQGWPDAYEKIPLSVRPVRAAPAPEAPAAEPVSDLPSSDPLRVALAAWSFPVGSALRGWVRWEGEARQRVRVEAGYQILAEGRTWTTLIGRAVYELEPGQEEAFAFEIPSDGPITRSGDLYDIRWFVRGIADRPLARDLPAEVAARVVPQG